MTDLTERLKVAATSSPWRAGQPAPLLTEAAQRIEELEGALRERCLLMRPDEDPVEYARLLKAAHVENEGLVAIEAAEARALAAEARVGALEAAITKARHLVMYSTHDHIDERGNINAAGSLAINDVLLAAHPAAISPTIYPGDG